MAISISMKLPFSFTQFSRLSTSLSFRIGLAVSRSNSTQTDDIHSEHSLPEQNPSKPEDRNVSRLRRTLYNRVHSVTMPELDSAYKRTTKYRRRMYAKYGSASTLDPGIMWPSVEEIFTMVEEDKEWNPTLEQLISRATEKSEIARKEYQERYSLRNILQH